MDYVRGLSELTLKGFVAVNAPTIFKGWLNTFLHSRKVTVEKMVTLVEENQSLWSLIPKEHYDRIRRATKQAGNLDWLTVDWTINAVKKEHPALASLFLGWRKGRNWLGRQLEEIKQELL